MSKRTFRIVMAIFAVLAAISGYHYYKFFYLDADAMNARQLEETNYAYAGLVSAIAADQAEYEYTVYINPVTGGSNQGLVNGPLHEADIVLDVANYVKSLNEDGGLRVVLARETDTNPTPAQRTSILETVHPDIIIELHVAADANPSAMGVVAHYDGSYYNYELAGDVFADAIVNGIASRCETKIAGVYADGIDIYALEYDRSIPTIAVECGYISNNDEGAALSSDAYRQNIARGILDGIAALR